MSKDRVQANRPLSTEERALCEWLIEHGSKNAASYAAQLERVTVVGGCRCGCPSITMAVDGAATTGPCEIIGDALGDTRGIQVGVMLHCREGQLSELEVYPFEDQKEPFGLPTLGSLKSIVDE